jgi:hypothetical protein
LPVPKGKPGTASRSSNCREVGAPKKLSPIVNGF